MAGGSCKRDAFPFPFTAGSPAWSRGSSPWEDGGFVEAFADTELIPDFHHLPAKFPAPPPPEQPAWAAPASR